MTLSRSVGSRFDGTLGATTLDMRLTLAGLLAPGGAGLAARPGVFPGAPALLVTGTTAWTYSLAAATFATSRGAADGAHILTNNGPLTVGTDAAPGTAGTSRIDIIYVRQPSTGENDDTSSTPVLAVAKGNPSTGTPLPPSLPAGALELARNTMGAGATSTSSAGNTIVQTWRYTALRGTPILVRNSTERDELAVLASAAFPITVDRLDTATLERNAGTGWLLLGGARAEAGVSYLVPPASSPTWRAPTTKPNPPLTLTRVGTEVTLRGGGGIENATTLSTGGYGQIANAFLLPSGFRPASTVRVPAMIAVEGQFLAAGQLIIEPTGVGTVQTTTAIASTAAGNVLAIAASVSWTAGS